MATGVRNEFKTVTTSVVKPGAETGPKVAPHDCVFEAARAAAMIAIGASFMG